MKSDSYVVIQGWMCNELELKGNELLVFALIHGFSQDDVSKFYGGRKYIADTFNISLPTVDKALQGLLDKQYIIKQSTGDFIHTDSYNINYEVVKKLYQGSKETLLGGSKETLHKNIDNKKKENKESNSKELLQNFEFGGVKQAKSNLYSKCIALINAKTADAKTQKLLTDWFNMLLEKYKARGKVLYQNVFKGKLNTLDEYDVKDWNDIIKYNTQRGYEAFYPIKQYSKESQTDKSYEKNVTSRKRTRQEEIEHENWVEEMKAKGVKVVF